MSSRLLRLRIRQGIGAALLAISTVHSAVYFTVTARIEAALPALMTAAAEAGWRLETATPKRAGWPWAPTIRLTHVIVARAAPVPLRWTAEQIDLVTPFYDMAALHILPAGAQTIQLPPDRPAAFETVGARLRLPFSTAAPATLSIDGLTTSASTVQVQVEDVQAETRTSPSGAAMLGMTVGSVRLMSPFPVPFAGPMTASMQIVANNGPCSPSANPAEPGAATIQFRTVEIAWGPLTLTASGSGRLDQQCQPAGRASLRVKGAVEMVDALTQRGIIAPGQASAARAVLGLLSLATRGGPVTLPVELSDRTLSIANFPLLRLPAIDSPP